jgi:hypothetical protein
MIIFKYVFELKSFIKTTNHATEKLYYLYTELLVVVARKTHNTDNFLVT